jgi:hypothetical protein
MSFVCDFNVKDVLANWHWGRTGVIPHLWKIESIKHGCSHVIIRISVGVARPLSLIVSNS